MDGKSCVKMQLYSATDGRDISGVSKNEETLVQRWRPGLLLCPSFLSAVAIGL